MPLPSLLQAPRLFSSDGNIQNISEASPNERNMYLNIFQQQGSDSQAQMAAEWSAPYTGAFLATRQAQQASHSASQLLDVEQRLTQAENDIQKLKETCHKLELYLEQYELINQELAAQVIDLQTKLKAT